MIFDPYPPTVGSFFTTIRRQIWQIFDPSPPLKNADVLNGWSLWVFFGAVSKERFQGNSFCKKGPQAFLHGEKNHEGRDSNRIYTFFSNFLTSMTLTTFGIRTWIKLSHQTKCGENISEVTILLCMNLYSI